MSNAILDVRELVKRFGPAVAVDGVSFEAGEGEVVGVLGPNGAGKTTTMRMIAGYLRPDAGAATICGYDVVDHPTAAQSVLGYPPEGAPAYGDMTPRGFLDFIAAARGLTAEAGERAVAQAIVRTQLDDVAEQRIDTLSKGFRRRVGLAQAILTDPPALVLDEPTDGLDPNQKHAVRNLIRSMSAKKAILISTHLLEEVEALCTRVIVIDKGRLAADETPQALLRRSRYRNAVTVEAEPEDAAAIREALQMVRLRADLLETAADPAIGRGPVFLVRPKNGEALIRDIVEIMAVRDLKPRAIYAEPGRLDDVFRALTTADVGPRALPASAA